MSNVIDHLHGAKNGRKIPYLSKGLIFKLTKTIGQSKCVSCYIEHIINDSKIPIILEFDNETGLINLRILLFNRLDFLFLSETIK